MTLLQDVDCIQAYDVEHIISNSYGADNSDPNNGVLLDSRINRTKVSLVSVDLYSISYSYIKRSNYTFNMHAGKYHALLDQQEIDKGHQNSKSTARMVANFPPSMVQENIPACIQWQQNLKFIKLY